MNPDFNTLGMVNDSKSEDSINININLSKFFKRLSSSVECHNFQKEVVENAFVNYLSKERLEETYNNFIKSDFFVKNFYELVSNTLFTVVSSPKGEYDYEGPMAIVNKAINDARRNLNETVDTLSKRIGKVDQLTNNLLTNDGLISSKVDRNIEDIDKKIYDLEKSIKQDKMKELVVSLVEKNSELSCRLESLEHSLIKRVRNQNIIMFLFNNIVGIVAFVTSVVAFSYLY